MARRQARQPLWADRWSVGLVLLAAALNAALALALWRRYELLPELVALHFNAYGEVDLIGDKREIFKLPLIGAVIWAANAAVATAAGAGDRVLARTLVSMAVLVQVLLAVAAWRILS
ncbi:MAG: DUF1648 domain-containing protein [Chloroflexi bacterium]|nr:DUF1648 domain-containing protein [Chloroflexota bacterium]